MARQRSGKAKIKAIWNSKCAETGTRILKGEEMIYNYDTKKCYSLTSTTATTFERAAENNSTADHVAAQENAYFDNFVQSNNL
jgi:hypothetical protein